MPPSISDTCILIWHFGYHGTTVAQAAMVQILLASPRGMP